MRLIRRLLKRRTYVYPLDNRLFGDVWLISTMNAFEAFRSDWRRYGLHVALYNLRVIALDK